MATTENFHNGNGSTSEFAFTFPYLKETDIKVSVSGTVKTVDTHYTLHNATTIKFTSGNIPPSGSNTVRIYRETDDSKPAATFYAGSAIRAGDLNDNTSQTLYAVQETNNKSDTALTNSRVDNGDGTYTSAISKANTATATANTASTNASNAVTTANTAATNASNAVSTANTASTNATNAVNTANAASTNATNAVNTANAAWQTGDETITSSETWYTTDDTKIATTKAIQAQLDLKQNADAELTELATMSSGTASALADLTQTEVQVLDGATVTTDELNILDGVTATAAELNKTDGLLATPTELNTLDGITSNTSELNKLDGVTASTTELNIVAGKTFKTSSGTLDTTSDTEIPSSKVIAAHVASSQTAIGGFTTIADEVSFPNTQPANGVVVSINNAAGVVINGSGVSTSGKRVDNTTVTINGFPSSLYGETLAAGVGLIVVSTSTANTYSYHKILTSETDVKQLSDDINDFNSRYRIASSAPSSNNDEGDLYFDTNANKMKVYNGSAWDDVASVGSFFVNTLSSSGSGSDTIPGGSATFNGTAKKFTLSNPGTSAQQHIVSINGVVQKPNSGTSVPSEGFAISGNDIIFSTAPATGADFFIITCGSSVSIGTPSANSVNSSHIIDGSIVNGDISSTADIALSKLDTTGTANNTTYLRGDGAWTNFSSLFVAAGGGAQIGDWTWQDQSSNIYFRLLSSGHGSVELKHDANFNIDDGSKIQIGTGDDFQVHHDGTNTNIYNATGRLDIKGDHISIWDKSGSAALADFNLGGAVELYHNGSKKIETTSGGVDITGAISVNGAPLSAAPTIDLVADGAIAAGKPVIVTSAGKAEQVRYVATMQTTPTIYIGATEVESSGANCSRSCWDPDLTSSLSKGTFWNIYIDAADGDKVKFVGNTNDGWPQNKGDIITLNTGAASDDDVAIDYDTQNDKIITAYRIGNNLKARTITATNITTANITANTEVTISTTGQTIAMAYGTSGKFLIMYSDGPSTASHYCKVCTVASDGTISQGSAVEFANSTDTEYSRCVYAPEIDKFLILYTKSSDSNHGYCRVATISGTSVSFGTEAEFAGVDIDGIAAAWDSKNEKFAILYNGTSDYLYAKTGTVSGTDISFGSETQISGNTESTRPEVVFSKLSNSFVAIYRTSGNSGRGSARNFAINGTGFDVKSGEGSSLTPVGINKPFGMAVSQVVMGTGPDIVAHYTTRDSSGHLQISRLNFIDPGSNLDSNKANFIGFAPSAVSNGATGTFNIRGNTIGSQSGLTPGVGYAVQNDGTLGGTLSSSQVGITALTSTTGLIRSY